MISSLKENKAIKGHEESQGRGRLVGEVAGTVLLFYRVIREVSLLR